MLDYTRRPRVRTAARVGNISLISGNFRLWVIVAVWFFIEHQFSNFIRDFGAAWFFVAGSIRTQRLSLFLGSLRHAVWAIGFPRSCFQTYIVALRGSTGAAAHRGVSFPLPAHVPALEPFACPRLAAFGVRARGCNGPRSRPLTEPSHM
jgi:hypothetical protein